VISSGGVSRRLRGFGSPGDYAAFKLPPTSRHDRHLAEIALAHVVGSDVERAYRRGDMLDRRRAMPEAWARFLTGGKSASVVPFPMKEAVGG